MPRWTRLQVAREQDRRVAARSGTRPGSLHSGREDSDPILLGELMAMRTLLLNLFSAASKGPLTDESLRKMLAYADSIDNIEGR